MRNIASKNPDFKKIKRLIRTLMQYPEGIWIRKLSRESKISLSTVHYYIENYLDKFIESSGAKSENGKYFGIRVIKLKPGIIKRLKSGDSLEKIFKIRNVFSDFE